MAKDKYDAGDYRVTVVVRTGEPTTKKFKSRRKAYEYFSTATKHEYFRYGIILDIGDVDKNYWKVIDERTAVQVRTIAQP